MFRPLCMSAVGNTHWGRPHGVYWAARSHVVLHTQGQCRIAGTQGILLLEVKRCGWNKIHMDKYLCFNTWSYCYWSYLEQCITEINLTVESGLVQISCLPDAWCIFSTITVIDIFSGCLTLISVASCSCATVLAVRTEEHRSAVQQIATHKTQCKGPLVWCALKTVK